MHDTAIWWIRRDLRLADNEALTAALAQAQRVIPLFILDPALLQGSSVSTKRVTFLLDGLAALDADLRRRGSRLIVRRGRPEEALAQLVAESGATAVFAEEDYSSYARRRDEAMAAVLPLTLVGGVTVHPPGLVLKPDGSPYKVFTPFSRAWRAMGLPRESDLHPAPATLPDPGVDGVPIPTGPESPSSLFPAGEREARRRLAQFLQTHSATYHEMRNRLDLDGTSRLSPYLRFGMLSARAAAVAARPVPADRWHSDESPGIAAWLNELIWRDFYIHVLYHFSGGRVGLRASDRILWRNDLAEFDAWRTGRTGYPVVDAAMRQLAATGWMPNRARMIVASFLVKDLLIDWRWGEKWFMQQLIDGDPAANNGGWQWTAGTGTDAAPYFRVFNPITQGRKFDPDGEYVRRWVRELAGIPGDAVHAPWRLGLAEQRVAGCIVGHDYPRPIVDHAAARERTLMAYRVAEEVG